MSESTPTPNARLVRDWRNFYLINREVYRLGRVAATWDAAKLAWRCRRV